MLLLYFTRLTVILNDFVPGGSAVALRSPPSKLTLADPLKS